MNPLDLGLASPKKKLEKNKKQGHATGAGARGATEHRSQRDRRTLCFLLNGGFRV